MSTEFTALRVEEPSTPEAGAILIADEQHNDIAEFFHCEHATVAQSYETALSLAQLCVVAPEMYSVLKELADALPSAEFMRSQGKEEGPALKRMRAVLAKAEGRS